MPVLQNGLAHRRECPLIVVTTRLWHSARAAWLIASIWLSIVNETFPGRESDKRKILISRIFSENRSAGFGALLADQGLIAKRVAKATASNRTATPNWRISEERSVFNRHPGI